MVAADPLRLPFESGPYGTPSLTYDRLRAASPVCRALVPSGWPVWLVTRYADISKALKDTTTFSRDEAVRVGASLVDHSGVELEPGVLQNTDGADHRRLRDLFSRHFGPGHDPEWSAVVQREAHAAIDELDPTTGRVFDLREDFFENTATRCARELFGFPEVRGPTILENFFDKHAHDDLKRTLDAMLRDRGALRPGSLFDTLAAACEDGAVSRGQIVDNVLILVTATFQATAAPFLGGVFALLRDRSQWMDCLADPTLRASVVDEMLRMFPNGDLAFLRIATSSSMLGGVEIARGEAIVAPVAAANTDPEVFADPRRFDCRRANSTKHIAFGIGKHFCLGAFVAKAWMRAAFDVLLQRIPELQLAIEPDQVRYRSHPLITILEALPVSA